jgi:hypothetical protein
MVPGIGPQLFALAPTRRSDANTISISVRHGGDGRSSSIVLPREHLLARHLEQLMSQAQPLQQPSASHDLVRALSSVAKHIHANSRYEAAPDALVAALFSSLLPAQGNTKASVDTNMEASNLTEQQLSNTVQQHQTPAVRSRRRRSSTGRTRVTKHCKVLGCANISVSRGLCRGHGGGRRCHYFGCSKSAQSRSVFCWAHGGGHRCEVENCMRSCKSKHFCAEHVNLENAPAQQTSRTGGDSLKLILNDVDESPAPTQIPRNASLPSLQDVLRNSQQTSISL